MGGDFSAPSGDGTSLTTSGTMLGTLHTDLGKDVDAVKKAVSTATSSWIAPRAEDFKTAVFGIQAELTLVMSGTGEVATIVDSFARAWKAADHEIEGYRNKAAPLQRQLDTGKDTDGHPLAPFERLALEIKVARLADQADDARRSLGKLAHTLAARIDDQTDKLVPKGSTLSPDQIRRRVDGVTGVGPIPPANAAAAWKMMKAARAQGEQVLDLTIDNKMGGKVGGPVTSLPVDPSVLQDLLDAARADGIDPQRYAGLLAQYWAARAAKRAGIDLDAWDPTKGTDGNRSTISAVYTFYGKLYLHDPEKLQWAGMANMIGPSFAGGFLDIDLFKDLAGHVLGPADALPDWARALLPPPLKELDTIGRLSAHELNFFETKFLAMQKHIFFDQGAMHEAYVDGGDAHGLANIREMREAGLIDDRAMNAWTEIDSGIPSLIKAGNTDLLYREQNQIIDRQYDEMRNYHGPVGEAFTYLMTVVGAASIPGTKTPAEFSPFSFTIKASTPLAGPEGEVDVKTTLPDFNVSDKDSRWDYVTKDTLPAYQKLLAEHPDEARRIIASDVDDRIDDQRLAHRWPQLLDHLATEWDIDVKVGEHLGPIHVDFDVPFL